MLRLVIIPLLLWVSIANAQFSGGFPDIPVAADMVPPTDVYGGTTGNITNQFLRPDAARPRVTRSMLVTLDAAGLATANWSAQPLPAGSVVNLTPIYSGTNVPKCWVTSAATTTSVPIKCVIENNALLNLSIITAGLNLNSGASAAGLQINVVVLPPSQ